VAIEKTRCVARDICYRLSPWSHTRVLQVLVANGADSLAMGRDLLRVNRNSRLKICSHRTALRERLVALRKARKRLGASWFGMPRAGRSESGMDVGFCARCGCEWTARRWRWTAV
jgi:hypothetical protein